MTKLASSRMSQEVAEFTPTAPSQKPDAQGPVEKPGEPLAVTTRTIPEQPPGPKPAPEVKPLPEVKPAPKPPLTKK